MNKFLNLLIPLFLTSCNSKIEKDYSHLKVSKIDTSKIKIFKYENKDKYCRWIFKSGINSDLTDKDLIKIENSIDEIIEKQNPIQIENFKIISKTYPKENYKLDDFLINKNNYIRKYLVIKNSKNEKLIYVNLICNDMAKYEGWKETISEGFGGGSCVFSFKLNLTTNKLYDVYFHSEA